MQTDQSIRDHLRHAFDPETSLNIIDLGLLEHLSLTPAPEAPGANIPGVPPRQNLTLTLVYAPKNPDSVTLLQAQILNLLAGLPGLHNPTIHFAQTPPWTPDRLSPEARRLLTPTPFPILNNH